MTLPGSTLRFAIEKITGNYFVIELISYDRKSSAESPDERAAIEFIVISTDSSSIQLNCLTLLLSLAEFSLNRLQKHPRLKVERNFLTHIREVSRTCEIIYETINEKQQHKITNIKTNSRF